MPPYRGRKEYRCSGYAEEAGAAAKLAKAAKPRQPKKVLTPEEKEAAALEKEERKKVRKAKETWEATLVPWVPNDAFRFPLKTTVLYKSDAKSAYGLTDKEMATLKHESIPRSAKTFFAQEDAKNLARRKFMAGAGKPGFQLDEVKGELRLFHKALDRNDTLILASTVAVGIKPVDL
ncbi:hypothetical protein M413DRAFT_11730 [Hebeloma cylindrosporum]|uniref:Uncharacterized protein n=1 Tax=Hebeloma cylindrosporum TaxID=76867 RepID=A0A0C2YGM4_HEBCY|nr:hypothetical protein M413DRAFT_11730 [Hebeloma cylindrosporum h7]